MEIDHVVAPSKKMQLVTQASRLRHRLEASTLGAFADEDHRCANASRRRARTKAGEGLDHHIVALDVLEAAYAPDDRRVGGKTELATNDAGVGSWTIALGVDAIDDDANTAGIGDDRSARHL